MTPLIVAIAAFVGVAALVGSIAFMFRGAAETKMEDRLTLLAASGSKQGKGMLENSLLLNSPLDHSNGFLEDFVERFGSLSRLFEQADTNLTPARFLTISALLGAGAAVAFGFAGIHPGLIPVMAIGAALLPLMWLIMRRRRRLSKFAAQLPDALELIARALRAGHSLAAGFDLVAKEMTDPIGREFGRIFEEQNLGIAMEDALMNITRRVPNLDLKFFVTAIILQRQTGGDLAEILDKIGHLIRERFQIHGAVQALTGEGRLSGVVLLALPPVLFIAVYRMNPDYMMILFSDDMGKQMLIGAVISQLIGALVIRKIVNIKV